MAGIKDDAKVIAEALTDLLKGSQEPPMEEWPRDVLEERCLLLQGIFSSMCVGLVMNHREGHNCTLCDMEKADPNLAAMVAIEALRELRFRKEHPDDDNY